MPDGGQMDRREKLCTRTDHGPLYWPAKRIGWTGWMGGRGRGDQRPREDLEACGCPGGYRVSRFFASVTRYVRRGERSNRHYDLCTDPLVLDAVAEVEAHLDRISAYAEELVYRG